MPDIQTIARQFALDTRLFNNVLEGVSDEQSGERINEHINHLQWIAGHLVNSRCRIAATMGIDVQFPYVDVYTDTTEPPPHNRALNDTITYPTLSELKKYWNEVSPVLVETMGKIPEAQLASPIPFKMPHGDNTLFGLFTFLVTHEGYHIGQMSTIRRYLGLGPMSFA